ncbi:MAG: chromosome segregation protein SMC [Tepidisphaeraceae bacterium]
MRLRKLVLHGFKSFADRTEFLFDQPVTCIVGPNGCGKSNVVDAVKWVLGEQSAKSLRGDAMLDVVFNGSSQRKPAGMAEVILVFENPVDAEGKRVLNLNVDEVAVGRRLYRDGTSEYTLAGKSARLKDIRDLFLDTGVGVDAYSVIEQGRVSQLLESNPTQRRVIFEEAAGISRFKVKKKEAQRKLEKVDQNLLRVNDVTQEVDRRLRGVKVQAGKARNYQELSVRLNELRLGYSLQEYHRLHGDLTRIAADVDETNFRVDDVSGDLAKRQNELAGAREQGDVTAQSKQRAEHELVEAQAAVRAAHQKQNFADQQLKQIAEQLQHVERDHAAALERRTHVDEQLQIEAQKFEQLTAELNAKRAEIESKQQAFKDDQLKLNDLINQIEKNKQAVLDLMRRLSQVNSRLASIEIERKNIAHQQQRQNERRAQVNADIEAAETRLADVKAKLEAVLQQVAQRQAEHDARKQAAAALGQQIKTITEQLGSAKENRSGLLSRQKVLQDLEARREGVSEAVKKILKERDAKYPFVQGIVADLLRVDVEHAQAIEAALDGRDQWLVVESLDAISPEALKTLSGRVSFVARSAEHRRQTSPGENPWADVKAGVRLAVDLLKVDYEHRGIAEQLLGTTAIVDTLADAIELHRTGPIGWRFVTRQGYVVEADGAVKAGPLGASMGILSRRSELDSVAQHLVEVDQVIARVNAELAASSQQAKQVEEEINQLRNGVYQLNTQKVELTSQQTQVNDRLASFRRELPLLDRELQNLLAQTDKLAEEEKQKLEQKQQMDGQQAGLQEQIESFTEQQASLAEQVKRLNEELTTCRVSIGQVQEKQLSTRQTVERLRSQQNEVAQQIERLDRTVRTAAERREGVEAEAQRAKHEEQVQTERVAALRDRVATLSEQLKEMVENVKNLTAKVESIRGLHSELEQKLHQMQIQQSELNVRREALMSRTQDELQIDIAERYRDIVAEYNGERPGSAVVAKEDRGPFPYDAGATDWDEVGREIKELKDRIGRLGNVNLDSIGELEELEERQTFYANQLNDLREAKEQLEQLIDEINRESGVRFEQTFNAVREHFQHLFRQLFGGGSADVFLELEVEDREAMKAAAAEAGDGKPVPVMRKTVDPLDAGIEIIARPPGKKPVTISQLSGGEKAMTCIALLMSIFKSKPSPFCILDEVDAPLDEANNVRFGLIVKEFLSLSQFIIITHHKRTMQIGDVLYGVTQQEQGVSKRVAVKFDQVQQGGKISEAAVAQAERAERLAEAEADVVDGAVVEEVGV